MEKVTLDPAIKFGAGRYRQEKNLLEECGKEISRFGKRAFIIAGNRAWDAVKERMIPGFEKEDLQNFYPEFKEYEPYCRFKGCSHISEPDCGVKEALAEGKISPLRYENYKLLYEELKDVKKY